MATKKTGGNCCSTIAKREINDIACLAFWRAVLVEGIASLFICYMVLSSELHNPSVDRANPAANTALCSGFFVGAVIMATDHISGGHINPAVSIGFAVQRKITFLRFLFYVGIQIFGGYCGVCLLKLTTPTELFRSIQPASPKEFVTEYQAIGTEFMLAFLLIFVVMAGADKGRCDVRGSVSLMVGLTVAVGIFAGMPTSGGIINPVIQFGPAILRQNFTHSWVYWVGDMLGGGVAGILYNKVFSTKDSCTRCHRKKDDDVEDERAQDKPQWQAEKSNWSSEMEIQTN